MTRCVAAVCATGDNLLRRVESSPGRSAGPVQQEQLEAYLSEHWRGFALPKGKEGLSEWTSRIGKKLPPEVTSLATLRAELLEELRLTPGADADLHMRVYLLCGSGRGKMAAHALASLFQQAEMDRQGVSAADPREIEDLTDDASCLATGGLNGFWTALGDCVEEAQQDGCDEVVFNLTPGWKVLASYATAASMVTGCRSFYVFEGSPRGVWVPPLPMSFDRDLWFRYRSELQVIGSERAPRPDRLAAFQRMDPRLQVLFDPSAEGDWSTPMLRICRDLSRDRRRFDDLSPDEVRDLRQAILAVRDARGNAESTLTGQFRHLLASGGRIDSTVFEDMVLMPLAGQPPLSVLFEDLFVATTGTSEHRRLKALASGDSPRLLDSLYCVRAEHPSTERYCEASILCRLGLTQGALADRLGSGAWATAAPAVTVSCDVKVGGTAGGTARGFVDMPLRQLELRLGDLARNAVVHGDANKIWLQGRVSGMRLVLRLANDGRPPGDDGWRRVTALAEGIESPDQEGGAGTAGLLRWLREVGARRLVLQSGDRRTEVPLDAEAESSGRTGLQESLPPMDEAVEFACSFDVPLTAESG